MHVYLFPNPQNQSQAGKSRFVLQKDSYNPYIKYGIPYLIKIKTKLESGEQKSIYI